MRVWKHLAALAIVGLFYCPVAVAQEAADRKSSDSVQLNPRVLTGFFQKHCMNCHGEKKQKGDLRLDTLSRELSTSAAAERWQEVLDALNLGHMPPEGRPRPTNVELEPVLEHLTDSLLLAKKRLSESGGDVFLRRLNRREYQNTIEDLIGLKVNPELIPPDDIAEGYDTVGHDQQFSAYHFDGYFEAAQKIVETGLFWADRPRAEPSIKREEAERRIENLHKYVRTYDAMMARIKAGEGFEELGFGDEKAKQMYIARHPKRTGARREYLKQPHLDSGVYLDSENIKTGVSIAESVDPRASYRLRVVAGLCGDPPLLRQFVDVRLGATSIGQLRVGGTITEPEVQEMAYRPTMDLQNRSVININENRNTNPKIEAYVKSVDPGGAQSSIWIDRLESEGPFYSEPTIFETLYDRYIGKRTGGLNKDGLTSTTGVKTPRRRKNPGVRNSRLQDRPESKAVEANPSQRADEDERARQFIEEFALHAFRNRKPSAELIEKLFGIYTLRRDHGHAVTSALVTPLAMILSSPSFLYLVEDAPESDESIITHREFANRLSYFLWSRTPDKELLRVADEGKLYEIDILKAQVQRMLDHPNRWALAEGFMAQWADLKRFDDIAIDLDKHHHFNNGIRRSARLEVQHFFDTLIEENLSIDQLIDSDFAVIDGLLASQYDIDLPESGNHFRKVTLPTSSPRGGMLGQMAFLTAGSNGERSSPIIRGVLVAEKFLHQTIASPPANVPELAAASDKALPVKEIVELHQRKAQCASCHRKLDPIGFGLENFDVLGRWRDEEIVGNIGKKRGAGKTIAVRSSGVFPNGATFNDVSEFRAGLFEQKNKLARSITEGLLSYGLGRHVEFSDQQAIGDILKMSEQNDHRLGDLIFAIVNHSVFRRSDRLDNK